MAPVQPSQAEIERRKIVGVNFETVTNVSSTDFPGHFPGEDHAWAKDNFRNNFQVKFYQNDPLDSRFSLIGIDASVANAFRRIMIAEIPTLAIEYVFIHNNTSIIQDEVLASRLGLVPLKGGHDGLQNYLRWFQKPSEEDQGEDQFAKAYDYNTITLSLKVECSRNTEAVRGEQDPKKAYHNAHVYARDIKFTPFGEQVKHFEGDNVIAPTNPDILIAKLRPGQCIDIEMHAIKGVGSDHAKFSPVATASYRLLPTIDIIKPILGGNAELFAKCFPPGVIGFETVTAKEAAQKGSGYESHEGEKKAVVLNAMGDTVSRECLRHDELKDRVKLGRIRDHFIFSVESVGQWDSDQLFLESVKLLRVKCAGLKKNLALMTA